ncbi:MAG: hypothetical protein Q4A09_05835 [Capnocytophaga felis]|nr:hypothetical protein [Capnocytophaga felis]
MSNFYTIILFKTRPNFQIKNAEGEIIAGTEVPKTPKTKEDFDTVSEVHLQIDIPEGK